MRRKLCKFDLWIEEPRWFLAVSIAVVSTLLVVSLLGMLYQVGGF